MTALQLFPAVLSLLVLGAHFLRVGQVMLLVAVVAMLVLLAVRRPWAARVVQVGLLLGAFEWIRTLIQLAGAWAAAQDIDYDQRNLRHDGKTNGFLLQGQSRPRSDGHGAADRS